MSTTDCFLDMLFGNNRIKEINAVEHYILDTRLYDVESEDIKMEFLFAMSKQTLYCLSHEASSLNPRSSQ